MKRSPIRRKRPTPRRRGSSRWDAEQWRAAEPRLRALCGGRCDRCGKDLLGGGERHHRIRRRDGGDRFANLLMLCRVCHGLVHQHPEESKANGWIVPPTGDVLIEPVRIRGWWYLLDDLGHMTVVP